MNEKQAEAIKNFDDAELITMYLSYYKKCVIDSWLFEGEAYEIYNALYAEIRYRMKGGRA